MFGPGDRVVVGEYNRIGTVKYTVKLFTNFTSAAVVLDKPIIMGETPVKKIHVPVEWLRPLEIKIVWEV